MDRTGVDGGEAVVYWREVKAVMESATGMFLDEYVVSHGGKIIQDSEFL